MAVSDGKMVDIIERTRAKMAIEADARLRFGQGAPGMARRNTKYREFLRYYAPPDNDQWPEDKYLRPSKVHITANIVRAYCDICARLLSIPPRLINRPASASDEARRQAEQVERFYYRLMEMTEWEVWLSALAQSGEVYGIGYLKPYWNNYTDMPDVSVLEQPQNLMLGYGTNDFSVVDWAIYRSTMSYTEANSRFPGTVTLGKKGMPNVNGNPANWASADKADVVDQRSGNETSALGGSDLTSQPSTSGRYETYEQTDHLEVWDYWYREDGKIYNATMLAGFVVDGPNEHAELPVIPYIPYESGHELGSPEGLSTVELLRDVQMGYNRLMSLWTQYTLDNSGTAYQVTGPTSGDMPEGVIPKSDEFIPVGENEIKPIPRNSNNYPMEQLAAHYWQLASDLTGIPRILFGHLSGAQASGRATAIEIEAALNRLDPKRRRFYSALKDLLRVWGFMLSYQNKQVEIVEPAPVDPQAGPQLGAPQMQIRKIGMKELLKGYDHWRIGPPELTPRDSTEAVTVASNMVQAHLSSIEHAMDGIGIDDPLHELDLIRAELADARLNPGQVQSYISAVQLLLQLMQAQQQAVNPAAAGQTGENTQAAQNQQAQPTGLVDQNQPATGPGGAPPPGAGVPGGLGLQLQGLIRQQGGNATAMNQVVLPPVRG